MPAPRGNNNAGVGREATRALEKALAIRSGDADGDRLITRFKTLVEIWDKQIDAALEGELNSAREIFDRIEGKPVQAINASVDVTSDRTWG